MSNGVHNARTSTKTTSCTEMENGPHSGSSEDDSDQTCQIAIKDGTYAAVARIYTINFHFDKLSKALHATDVYGKGCIEEAKTSIMRNYFIDLFKTFE